MKTIEVQWLGRVEYQSALDLQNRFVGEYLSGTASEKLLLLEHEPVYTIGRTRDQSSLRSPKALPHPGLRNQPGRTSHVARSRPTRGLSDP